MAYRGVVKGKTIQLEDEIEFADGTKVEVTVREIEESWKSSPAALLQAIQSSPALKKGDIVALRKAIKEGQVTQNWIE